MNERSRTAVYQRMLIDVYKQATGCIDCKYDVNPRALQFDHRVAGSKKQNIADMPGRYSTQAILLEISKCDVRCANCHAVVTFERRA